MRILLVLILSPIMAFSQTKITIVRDTMTTVHAWTWPHAPTLKRALILSDGKFIETYSNLKLGIGSLPDGSFNYILKPSDHINPNLMFNTSLKELAILKIKKMGNKRSGYRYDLRCDANYVVHLNDALSSYEVIP
jgi:hypothetical protein